MIRNNKIFNKILASIFNRLGVLLLAVIIICGLISNKEMLTEAHSVRVLNSSIPFYHQYDKFISALLKNSFYQDTHSIKSVNFYFKKITKLRPNIPEAWGLLGSSYFALGKTDKAISAYKQAITKDPTSYWYHYNLGLIQFKNGNFSETIKHLSYALTINDQSTLMKTMRSPMIYGPILTRRKLTTPQLVYKELLSSKDNALALLIQSHFNVGNTTEALKYINLGKQKKSDWDGYYNYILAQIALQSRNYEQALGLGKIILINNPHQIDTLEMMKNIMTQANQQPIAQQIENEIAQARKLNIKSYNQRISDIAVLPY